MANKKLKEKCSYHRRRNGYQQKDLAARLNVTPSALSKWENGHVSWPPDALIMYCELLALNEDEKQELFGLAKVNAAVISPAGSAFAGKKQEESVVGISDRNLTKQGYESALAFSSDHVRQRRIKWFAFSIGLFLIGLVSFLLWNEWNPVQPVWQETFDPIQRRWSPVSAVWDDIKGPAALLKENNVDDDFGKVESEIIRIDVDKYPLLRIQVEDVDPDASFTVQILDKRTDIPKDVLIGITYPGEQVVNLGQELGWQGTQAFTINIWVSGEGKSIQFSQISIEAG